MDCLRVGLGVIPSFNRRCKMQAFCVLAGVILLGGCTALNDGTVKTSNLSESTWHRSYNSGYHSSTNNSYKTINETQVINGSKSTYPTNKKTKTVEQENYDAAIDNLSNLPEFILIHL